LTNGNKNHQLSSVTNNDKESNGENNSDNSDEISDTDSSQIEREKERERTSRILPKRTSKSNVLSIKNEDKKDEEDKSGFAYFMNSAFFS